MDELPNSLSKLEEKLQRIIEAQQVQSKEISKLQQQISALKNQSINQTEQPVPEEKKQPELKPVDVEPEKEQGKVAPAPKEEPYIYKYLNQNQKTKAPKSAIQTNNLEQILGKNLFNKIGIVILIIGVAFGTSYAINRGLITPAMRIALGYLVAIGLTVVSYRLRPKYSNYSAVLISGAMAIFYIISYIAFDFFHLYSAGFTFVLMVLITVATVSIALSYNLEIIAIIGLVGAYVLPFMLGIFESNDEALYVYLFIINLGILWLTVKKRWKFLSIISIMFSWLIVLTTLEIDLDKNTNLGFVFVMSSLYFILFYVELLLIDIQANQSIKDVELIWISLNSLAYFYVGAVLFDLLHLGDTYYTMFAVGLAIIQFLVARFVKQSNYGSDMLSYYISTLGVIFLSVALWYQFSSRGNEYFIGLSWAIEALVLFYFGRKNHIPYFEKVAYWLVFFSTFSLIIVWLEAKFDFYNDSESFQLFNNQGRLIFNTQFITGILVSICFLGILNMNQLINRPIVEEKTSKSNQFGMYVTVASFLLISYFTIFAEIQSYWTLWGQNHTIEIGDENSGIITRKNYHFSSFRTVWLFIYSFLYTLFISQLSTRSKMNKSSVRFITILTWFFVLLFCFICFDPLNWLGQAYLTPVSRIDAQSNIGYLLIRYVAYGAAFLSIWNVKRLLQNAGFNRIWYPVAWDILSSLFILAVLSNELLFYFNQSGIANSDQIALSILWSVIAFGLIVIGIYQRKKYLRILGIGLFFITLIKVFFYDLKDIGSLQKTIVFISIGLLLLLVSYLYNRFTAIIFSEDEKLEEENGNKALES